MKFFGDFVDIISSAQNNLVKKLKLLSTRKGRKRFGEFIVEGAKFVSCISGDWEIQGIFVSETFYNSPEYSIFSTGNPVVMKDSVFSQICDTVTPQGILAVVKTKEFLPEELCSGENPFILIACNLQDPGNLGTLIRTADAAGASGVMVSKDSADIFSPKVVRSTAGSLFNIPVATCDVEYAIGELKQKNINIIATDLSAESAPYEIDLTNPLAILIGNEANGISQELLKLADFKTKLPMIGKAESLNASVASGVLMYEVLRQRRG